MTENGIFLEALDKAIALPMVRIDRNTYLYTELSKHFTKDVVELALETNPSAAGIPLEIINKIADASINFETQKVSALSFAAGLPGGPVAVGATTADLAQYYAHIVRIAQKLAYLYGWSTLYEDGVIDDEAKNILMLFIGLMFGVEGVNKIINKLAESAATKTAKTLADKALTKTMIYPIVKKVAKILGQKMTKEIFAKNVSKIIPIVGGVVSGGLTYVSFKPGAKRLQSVLIKNYAKFAQERVDANEVTIDL